MLYCLPTVLKMFNIDRQLSFNRTLTNQVISLQLQEIDIFVL